MSSAPTVADEWAIRTEGLTRRYGEVLALDGLDLKVPYGAIFGFLGRNGAGKTTTMRLLAGLARPTAGAAWIAGLPVTGTDSPARAVLGYLPQEAAYYPWMTPREYLSYMGSVHGLRGEALRQRVEALLERVQLAGVASRRIGGFSGGMRQRLGIAQALVGEPRVLLLDEPTSGLDPAGRYELLDTLDKMRGAVTVFLSSHIVADVERICDLIGVIHAGKLLFTKKREALRSQFAVSVVELEFDAGQTEAAAALAQELAGYAWASSASASEQVVRAVVSDVETARRELLALAAQRALPLVRYEWVRPSLEEIFMEVSG
ncbi:MAG: ABC transporter ATP-binding protein [Chloroflexi bacterium]|nr:ABC transporter ATP-binding protein [Chloroflexota bacterium]